MSSGGDNATKIAVDCVELGVNILCSNSNDSGNLFIKQCLMPI